jgi:molybdate transport system ATP-binding protein
VFQHYALFPHMTADENIIAAMDHRPAGERRLRAGELLRLLHLEGLGSRKPQALSGGQQQRVAFARALARDPQVLLLDEPFSAVDRPTRNLLYREVAHLRGAIGAPIILVTHDFDEAARLADRMCLIDRGKVIQAGTPTEVLLHPVSARAARLVDHQNIFEAVVARHDGRRHRTVIIWQGRELEASHHPEFAAGNRVSWVIPSTHVILHRKEIAAEAPPNLLQGVIAEMATLSESMKVSVETEPGMRFSMTVPAHFTRRSALKVGSPVEIALQPEGLHLMTAD